MPSVERETSRDRDVDQALNSQLTLAEVGRSHVPMWDSSDPDRAPPPLPLNPSSPGPVTRTHTSATVAAAAAALAEKARESAGPSPYTTNPMPSKRDPSPEKSLIRGHHHKRMQSFQSATGNARDMGSYLDGSSLRHPEPSPERYGGRSGSIAHLGRDFSRDAGDSSPERSPTKANTPAPYGKDSGRITPTLRPSSRPPPKSILGDHTPPTSATMLALQNMPTPPNLDGPLPSTSTSLSPSRSPQTIEALSSQILGLTTIATNLQREMMQLSRRSKDNATDLVSLKEATNARDEDIRQCLRELVSNLSSGLGGSGESRFRLANRQADSGTEGFLIDNKPHTSPSTMRGTKNFALPRIPSPNSFTAVLERELANCPSPYSIDGAANLALLEKILREMATKDGQERLLAAISQVVEKSSKGEDQNGRRFDEIVNLIKDIVTPRILMKGSGDDNNGGNPQGAGAGGEPPRLELRFDGPQSGSLVRASKDLSRHNESGQETEAKRQYPPQIPTDFLGDDIQKLLRRLKDSVAENGGLTAEVKALVRELRGEVLGMGREMGRKLDALSANGEKDSSADTSDREAMMTVVQNSMAELKEHIEQMTKEKRRQSISSTVSKNSIDSGEIFDAVKNAMGQLQLHRFTGAEAPNPSVGKEEILEAIREGWENYKPEIELQNFGLEREEILQCLKEGLGEYRSLAGTPGKTGLSRDEILKVISDGLNSFTPPPAVTVLPDTSVPREEILSAVRDALETFEFPAVPAPPRGDEITKDDVVDAVKEGLGTFEFPVHAPLVKREVEITRSDIYDAVRMGLERAPTPTNGLEQEVLERLQEVIEGMRIEFKAVSDEAKQNVAANGRDTEQVLDALKDGLEHLRSHVELYVDRATAATSNADASGKDTEQVLDAMKSGLEHLRSDIELYVDRAADVTESVSASGKHTEQVLEALKSGLEHLRSDIELYVDRAADITEISNANGKDTEQILAALKGGLETLRSDVELYVDRAADVTGKDEIIEIVKDGFERLRTDVENMVAENAQNSTDGEVLEGLKGELAHLRETIAATILRSGSSSDRDDIIDAIRLGLDDLRSDILRKNNPAESILSSTGEILDALSDGFDALHSDIQKMEARPIEKSAYEELSESLKERLDGLRSDIQNLETKPVDDSTHEELATTLKEGLESLRSDIQKMEAKAVDTSLFDELSNTLREGLASLRADIDRMNDRTIDEAELSPETGQIVIAEPDSLKRNDIENLEVLIAQLRIKVEALDAEPREPPLTTELSQHTDDIVSKEDLHVLEQQLRNIEASITAMADKEREEESGTAKKEDVEAIETLLRNTKAKLDDIDLSNSENVANKDDIEVIEVLLKDTKDVVDEIAAKLKTGNAKKEDLLSLETLVREVKLAVEDVKEQNAADALDGEKVTKTDVDAVEGLCMDIKAQIDLMVLPDPENLPTKAQVNSLAELIKEHQGRTQLEVDSTMKAVEDTKLENANLVEGLSDLKTFLEDVDLGLKSRLDSSSESVHVIGKVLESLEERIGVTTDISVDVREVIEIVTREFERSHGFGEGLKLDQEARASELLQKVDERFEELMTRYDDAQLASEDAQKLAQDKAAQDEQVLTATKAVAEDLKLSADTLGITITEAADRMGQDSKTVFNRVEDTYGRVEDMRCETKADLSETKGQVEKALALLATLQHELGEYQPKLVDSVNDILSIVREHFEHSQKQATEIKMVPVPPPAPLPMIMDAPEKYDDAEVHIKLDKLINHATHDNEAEVHAKLDKLLSHASDEGKAEMHAKLDKLISRSDNDTIPEVHVKLDQVISQLNSHDSEIELNSKLDQLIDHASAARKSLGQMDVLDQIHQQVLTTASEVSAFFASQSKRIAEEQDTKEKQAEEASIALVQTLAQKQRVEDEMADLKTEKESLREVVAAMKAEKEDLIAQKIRLATDVASLETTRKLRHEELAMMEARAEALERRILEGIIDHSRALLISRPQKDPKSMSLKRVSSRGGGGAGPATSSSSLPQNGIGLALRTRPSPIRTTQGGAVGARSGPGGRRILSLNQITHNVPTGGQAFSPAPSSFVSTNKALGNLKRSHSVKTGSGTGYLRKASLGGSGGGQGRFDAVPHANKENQYGSADEDESESEPTEYLGTDDTDDDDRTETETERRNSLGTTTDRRTSTGTLMSGTGTMLTGSMIAEDDEEEHEEEDGRSTTTTAAPSAIVSTTEEDYDDDGGGSVTGKMVLYDGPADSGVGEEPTTADLEGKTFDEFR